MLTEDNEMCSLNGRCHHCLCLKLIIDNKTHDMYFLFSDFCMFNIRLIDCVHLKLLPASLSIQYTFFNSHFFCPNTYRHYVLQLCTVQLTLILQHYQVESEIKRKKNIASMRSQNQNQVDIFLPFENYFAGDFSTLNRCSNIID